MELLYILVPFLFVLNYFIDAKELLNYHKNLELLPPLLESRLVTSIQTCIHRCQIKRFCNVASFRNLNATTTVNCTLGYIECFERFAGRVRTSDGWDMYVLRKEAEKPFYLAFKGTTQNLCTRVDQTSGKLVLTQQCTEIFCLNFNGQMVNIPTRKCITFQFFDSHGAYLVLKDICDKSCAFREADDYGVQHVQSQWHLHPKTSSWQPSPGTVVVGWDSGKFPFFFKYTDNFF